MAEENNKNKTLIQTFSREGGRRLKLAPMGDGRGSKAPAGSCDAHFHVFGPAQDFPASPDAKYDLPDAGPGDYAALAKDLGLTNGVIVQPSYYGSDNRFLLSMLDANRAWRGIVIPSADADADSLRASDGRGVRGVRLDFFKAEGRGCTIEEMRSDFSRFSRMAADLGWSVDIYAPGHIVLDLLPVMIAAPAPVTVAHMGLLTHAAGISDDGCQRLVASIADSSIWMKLTGSYRYEPNGHARAENLAGLLIGAMPQRLLWGSDWPHVMAPPIDTRQMLSQFATWCPDEAIRHAILVENPRRLYDLAPLP